MEARLSQEKGVVIEEILEHNVVETVAGKEGKLLWLEWKDSKQVRNVVDIKNKASISKPTPLFERCNPDGEKIGTSKAHVQYFELAMKTRSDLLVPIARKIRCLDLEDQRLTSCNDKLVSESSPAMST
nr:hypothetical protein [Tanacetum cinerariifolium]